MRKLGRIRSHSDPRSLRLARYLDRRLLPGSPPARDWTHPEKAPRWGLYRNDVLGDCTCASIAHLFQAQSAASGRPIAIRDSDVIGLYARAAGYDPTVPSSDAGAEMIDVLREMRNGTGMAGQRIGAYVQIDPQSRTNVEAALNMLGGIYVGVDLPISAQEQTVWDVAPVGGYTPSYAPLSWGGHAMAMLGYDRTHVVFVTWGAVKVATREWFSTYCTEAWALIDSLWVDQTGLSPSGFNIELLLADLAAIDRAA